MPKKTVTIDVDENLLVVASNEISELLYEYDSELMSADEDVEAPSDFPKLSDQYDLMRAEVSE
ncbi:TPA: transcriptional regulator [Staphylococcus aureus]|nr:transcriptional regulator [Staphylococcus aureus]